MKPYRVLIAAFLFLGLFASLSLAAQDDREDVVYLKNGSIYRGIIVEQVPGVSLKVETLGGSVFNVAISDITKITKEKKEVSNTPAYTEHRGNYGYQGHGDRYFRNYRSAMGDSNDHSRKPQFHYRKRGYFMTAQLLVEALEGGGRLVNGYKFGRCGYLGVGVGVDAIISVMHSGSDYSGIYLPLYLYYGGDILKKRITPFYSIEAGYAMRVNSNNGPFPGADMFGGSNASSGKGGMMGGVGFGVKFYSRHRVFFSLSAHADFQQATNTYDAYTYSPNNVYYTYSYKTHTTLMVPGLRFGIGF